jgi:hypothetical protein
LIIKDVVEAAGVELFRILITRNLLIPGNATTAKKAPLPNPLYVYCTKIFPHFHGFKDPHKPNITQFAAPTKRIALSYADPPLANNGVYQTLW